MTDKQKQAIKVLNRLKDILIRGTIVITEDEYFMLMEFVMNYKPDIQYIPYTPNPLDHLPIYGQELKTTCNEESTNHLDNNNY